MIQPPILPITQEALWYARINAWVAECISIYGYRPKNLPVSQPVYNALMRHMTGGRVIKGQLIVNGCLIHPERKFLYAIKK